MSLAALFQLKISCIFKVFGLNRVVGCVEKEKGFCDPSYGFKCETIVAFIFQKHEIFGSFIPKNSIA